MTGEKEKRMAVAVGNRLSLLISRLFFFLEPQGVLSFHKRKKGLGGKEKRMAICLWQIA